MAYLQPNQIKMAVLFWYPIKSDATVHVYAGQVRFYKVPETHDHVYIYTLHLRTGAGQRVEHIRGEILPARPHLRFSRHPGL